MAYGFFTDGVLRGAAELRRFGGDRAEAAFSIEQLWQSHGIGAELLDRLLLSARNRGIKRLHVACLADNTRMQRLARKFNAAMRWDPDMVTGEVSPLCPTPVSVLRELIADGNGLAMALLQTQSRLLRGT